MIPFKGRKTFRDSSRGLLDSIGIKKAKTGAGDKDPAYILAQNTCLKFVVYTLLFIGFVIVILGTTIYKVELRSRAAQEATEKEKVLSRLEERNAHHKLIESHMSLRDALKGQIVDLQDMGALYYNMKDEIKRLRRDVPVTKYKPRIDSFAKRILNITEGVLEGMSKRGRKAQDLIAEMDRETRTEVARDQLEEARYHDFFIREKGRSHDQVSELEDGLVVENIPGLSSTVNGETTSHQDNDTLKKKKDKKKNQQPKIDKSRERYRVQVVVEQVFKWYRDELYHEEDNSSSSSQEGTSEGGGRRRKGLILFKKLLTATTQTQAKWRALLKVVESAMLEAAVGSGRGKRDLSALSHQLQNNMDAYEWNYDGSGTLREMADEFRSMIQAAGVVTNVDSIKKVEERYNTNNDVYEAMDGIEDLMVKGIIPEQVLNSIYGQIRASENKCTFQGPHLGTFLEGPIRSFPTLEAAQAKCGLLDDCSGITMMMMDTTGDHPSAAAADGRNNKAAAQSFSLRKGSKLHRSHRRGEKSWIKDCRGDDQLSDAQKADDALLQAQAEAIAGF